MPLPSVVSTIMSNMVRDWLLPDWTATRNDITWPWTHLLGVLVASIGLYIWYAMPFAANGEAVTPVVAVAALLVSFGVVPALALREQTEVLYDGMHVAFRVIVLGFMLFCIAYWTTPGASDGVSAFANAKMMASMTITVTGLYAAIVLGIMWVVQFARKGTSGVEPESL